MPSVTASEVGKAQTENPFPKRGMRIVVYRRASSSGPGINLLKQGVIEGENPVHDSDSAAYAGCSKSRVAWDCSPKWVVNFI